MNDEHKDKARDAAIEKIIGHKHRFDIAVLVGQGARCSLCGLTPRECEVRRGGIIAGIAHAEAEHAERVKVLISALEYVLNTAHVQHHRDAILEALDKYQKHEQLEM